MNNKKVIRKLQSLECAFRFDSDLQIIRDAVELLEEGVPHVLTLEEARKVLHDQADVIWMEFRDKGLIAAVWMTTLLYYMSQTDEILEPDDLSDPEHVLIYGRKFRLWSDKPDEQTRKEAKWDAGP